MNKKFKIGALALVFALHVGQAVGMRRTFTRLRASLHSRFVHMFKSRIYPRFQGMKQTFNQRFFSCRGLCNGLTGLTGTWLLTQQGHGYDSTKKLQTMNPATIWAKLSVDESVNKHDMKECYVRDCKDNVSQNSAIPVHKKNNDTVRIATYNVHFFRDAFDNASMGKIANVINTINPDVIVLQEVSLFDQEKIRQEFAKIGFTFNQRESFCKSMDAWNRPFGNMILSKYPFVKNPDLTTYEYDTRCAATVHRWDPREYRCYVKANIALPNNKTVTVYGTHLDVYDETETRRSKEVAELIQKIQTSEDKNVVIAADFNAVREQDYDYLVNNKLVWDMVNKSTYNRFGLLRTPTKALDLLEKNQFQNSFAKGGFDSPKWTVWSGTAVDFMYVSKTWQLPVVGSWVYYNPASDHLPVIMDVAVK